ncbi:LysR family transcriptional regulator substrate-binding protein [Veillonella seminalis]|uniref:LysR family transcriptional regulator substrate-binding protein n=1 Tax=Veillonella seminalis TaxID=1502943 RepID=UPI0013E0B0EB|nr:LysR family transcriptional regulator substrate-binding protein [Veillonella seminalis]
MADYPNITIYLKEGTNVELAKWLQEGVIDLSFSAKPSMKDEFDWIPVLTDELMAWLPERYGSNYGDSFPVKDLEKYPFIITQPDNDTDIDRVLHDLGIEADIHFSTKDAYATYKMVEADLGVSFNQQLIARDWTGKVTVLSFKPAQYIELGLALPSMNEASPVMKQFISYVKQSILEQGASDKNEN